MAGQRADLGPNVGDRWQAGFVGRRAELATLRSVLEVTRSSSPRLVLIDGPAGIGKTALVRRFLRATGVTCVLRASGDEAEMNLPFGVVEQLAADAAGAPLSPQLTSLRRGGLQADPLAVGGGLVDLLGVMQQGRPLVLVVDDLQWADSPSLHALTFALRRLRVDHVLSLLVTRDPDDPRLPGGLRRLLMSDYAVRLHLGGLEAGALRILAAELHACRLSARAARRLRDHTGGNPLHAQALLEELPSEVLERAEDPLPAPRSFATLVLGRLAGCPPDTRRLVIAAAVLGQSCALRAAGRLAGVDDPLPALEPAIAARLLEERITADRIIAFAHPLVRAAVYRDLGPARRAALHARAATLAEDVASMLRHRVSAAGAPNAVLAEEVAGFARQQARTGAWAAAAEQLLAAARLTPPGDRQQRLRLGAIECMLVAGDVADMDSLAAEVRSLGSGAWRDYVLGRLLTVAGRVADAEVVLTGAWHHTTDPALMARIAGQLAAICVLQARGMQAAEWAGHALELGPEQTATDVLSYLRLAGLGICGRTSEGLALVASLPDPMAASLSDLDALLGRGLLRTWADDLAGAHRDLVGVLAAGQSTSMLFRILALTVLGQAEYRMGRWDDAIVHGQLGVSLAGDADQRWIAPFCHAMLALPLAGRGLWEPARASVQAAQADARMLGYPAAVTYAAVADAALGFARGNHAEVVAALEPLLQYEGRDGTFEPGVMCWQDMLIDALVALGDHDRAAVLLARFESLAASRRRHSALAAAARARGNLEAARGNQHGANNAFQLGLGHAGRVDLPFERALLEAAYGAFLRRGGKRGVAATQLQAASERFAMLGALPYLERCEQELAACGLTPTTRHRPRTSLLTPQELAVARLAAAGLTNRQVAAELVISVKTVEYHLGNTFAKLGVTSRSQLVQRLQED